MFKRVTPEQVKQIEKAIIEFLNLQSSYFENIQEFSLNENIFLTKNMYSIEETKEYLNDRFNYHPILDSSIVEDLINQVQKNVGQGTEGISEYESSILEVIDEIAKRRGNAFALQKLEYEMNSKSPSCVLYQLKGELLDQLGQYYEAVSAYTKAIQLGPGRFAIYAKRGLLHAMNNNFDLALKDYSHALMINPNQPNIVCNQGTAYMKSGKYEDSLICYDKAIELDPGYDRAYYERGLLLVSYLNQVDKGLESIMNSAKMGNKDAISILSDLEE